MISFFNTIQYHFRYWVIKCAQVLEVYFLCFYERSKWILYYGRDTFTFYSSIWKLLLIYRKVDGSLFAYIVNLFGCFRSKYQKFFPIPIVVKPYWKYIGITFLIYSTDLQRYLFGIQAEKVYYSLYVICPTITKLFTKCRSYLCTY